jgi:type IX secretion system PorP/SprF family membrane protein
MKKITLLLCLVGMLGVAKAQQVEDFSLMRENAFVLNPALAGMQGWLHGTATFRKQYTKLDQSPYTAMLALDGQFTKMHIGLGGYVLHDVTGPTGKTSITVAAAYNLPINKKHAARYSNGKSDHVLSFGIAISAVQYRLRGDELLVNDANDPGLYTSKGFKFFPDASIGVYYRYKNNFYAGVSAPQLMGLNVNYRGNDGLAKIKKVQHLNVLVGGKIEFARGNFSIDPVAAFRWVKGAPPQGDVGLRAVMYKVFWLGGNYRSTNYMILDAGFNIKDKFTLSYAYDLNLAKYRRDIGSTHEITLSFKIEQSMRVYRGKGPALRF